MEEKYLRQVVCFVDLFVLRHSGTAQTNAISTYFMLQNQPRDVFSLFFWASCVRVSDVFWCSVDFRTCLVARIEITNKIRPCSRIYYSSVS